MTNGLDTSEANNPYTKDTASVQCDIEVKTKIWQSQSITSLPIKTLTPP